MSSFNIAAAEIQVGDIVTARSGRQFRVDTVRTLNATSASYRIIDAEYLDTHSHALIDLRADVAFDVTRTD